MSMKYNTHNSVSRQWNVCSAAAVGRIDILKSLVAKGADLNAVHGKGTPLYHALLHNQLRSAEYLLQNGAEITGSHYILVAYERNFESAVYLLCQYGAPKSWAAETAIRKGNRNKLRELLSRSEDVDSEYGWGDLLGQAIYRNNGMVDLLFECGATCKCSDIRKALRAAVSKCDASMLEMLLMRGADANAVDPIYSGGKSLILLSAEKKFTDGMKLLFQYGANGACSDSAAALACAIKERNLEMTQLLLSHGADANAVDPNYSEDKSLILLSAEYNFTDGMKLLFQYGANGACSDLAAALACAIKERNLEMMQLLLSHGADANGLYSDGITIYSRDKSLILLSAENKFTDGMKLLFQYGANGACSDLAEALACAVRNGNLEMMQLLLSRGADANGLYSVGIGTLLRKAELDRFDEGAKLLIQYGAKKEEHSQQAHGSAQKKEEHSQSAHDLDHFLHTGLGWLSLLFIIFLLYSC